MPEKPPTTCSEFLLTSVPAFWPMAMAASSLMDAGTVLYARNLFVEEEIKIHGELRPDLTTPNAVRLDLRTMKLRDYGYLEEVLVAIDDLGGRVNLVGLCQGG